MTEEAENTAIRVGLAMAVDICPGCAHADSGVPPRHYCRGLKPCRMFHPDNFYYDRELHRFWCHHWVNERGETTPAE